MKVQGDSDVEENPVMYDTVRGSGEHSIAEMRRSETRRKGEALLE